LRVFPFCNGRDHLLIFPTVIKRTFFVETTSVRFSRWLTNLVRRFWLLSELFLFDLIKNRTFAVLCLSS
jgi:hypothetical protein